MSADGRRDDDDLYGGTGQTRTRLPEGSGDVYGGARRPVRSSSRSLVTVVGVVVLLIAAIAFANRGDGGSSDEGDGSSGPRAGAAPTAASGTKPVDSGFAHDEQGVQSAAANYAVQLGSADMFDKAKRDRIVDAVYTPAVASARRGDLDKVYSSESFLTGIGLSKDGVAPSGSTFVSRIIPVGTRTTAYKGDTATVSIWYSSLFGLTGEGTQNPVSESWYTNSYKMRWVDGDWKVEDFTQKDGPVPVGRDQRASTADDMAKAVREYGGFTYAR
ncbi:MULTISPECIES: hypothetical protein [Streptomyces]|uniref:DUF8175 domain-containing protein n=1 Tax=Streptomyces xanthii TaxID=2768069 RepID=A0A7H1B8L8_9ACTN|nr:hypothetical protein [Streptomyces xanthii]QNS05073.1 hypothetical protein IAG42_16620 [Streptomyces xanthii]